MELIMVEPSVEIKPCPFCGVMPEYGEFNDSDDYPSPSAIFCDNENCHIKPQIWGAFGDSDKELSVADLAVFWNRRDYKEGK